LIACSLTKYTASEGDVIAGVVAVNPAAPEAAELRRRVQDALEPVYPRDLARLAAQIGKTDAVLARLQENTPRVAAFLSAHPKIKDVFWALHPRSRDNYEKIARTPAAVGGMISFSLRGPLEPFYDRLLLPKGPSFGMQTTLICPFMYLAHYDLVTSPAGRAELAQNGLDPDLLRLCVGIEPADDIIAALADALG
jgi:cystathionine gamma-synthase